MAGEGNMSRMNVATQHLQMCACPNVINLGNVLTSSRFQMKQHFDDC